MSVDGMGADNEIVRPEVDGWLFVARGYRKTSWPVRMCDTGYGEVKDAKKVSIGDLFKKLAKSAGSKKLASTTKQTRLTLIT